MPRRSSKKAAVKPTTNPKADSESENDTDDDAPEAVTLTQSKQAVQKKDLDVKNAQSSAKQKEREKRRELDRKLKERAEENKSKKEQKKGKVKAVVAEESADEDSDDGEAGQDPGSRELEARMLKAMKDAEGEMDEDDDHDLAGFDFEKFENGDDDDDEEEEDVELEFEDEEEDTHHLPDSLFEEAFKQSAPTSKPKSKPQPAPQNPKKRRRMTEPKDLSLGSRKVRVLASDAGPKAPLTNPSRKVKKFLDRSLALKGRASKPKLGWERRPVNIGLLRSSNGPAAHFVRNQS